ncbi:PREDICTED: uncharacterized protein LOC104590663 [Nelumbo nucifera]|uniref:Uncharacterized protein LOC104590663 n=1 Tax=Nelumbo nucifera TaxID=4432 RepID=A0A1U7ZIW9_NELNU|nr:PREDICTED: uncharacterized protein LOC104590663 [Nelumbo nucifera]
MVKNPREQINAIALRSGKTVGKTQKDDKEDDVADLQKETEGSTPKLNLDSIKLPILYLGRILKVNLDRQFEKFLDMPKYAKFLKEVISNKRKWEDCEMVKLNKECSASLQKKLPQKLKDPGSFSIPWTIRNTEFEKALCDLGASINLMPYSIFEKLGLHELTSTTITLQLVDRSIKYPRGIVDVLVKVGNFIIPADFIVLDMEEDRTMPLILGRPFLAMGNALIDVKDGLLTLRINGEVDTSKLEDTLKVALNNSPNQLQQEEQKFVLKSELRNLTSELDSFEVTTHNASFISLPPSHTKLLPSIVQAPIPGLNPPMKDEGGKYRKLKTRWSGPFVVAKAFPHGAIELHNGKGNTFKVNGQHLKHYIEGEQPIHHGSILSLKPPRKKKVKVKITT